MDEINYVEANKDFLENRKFFMFDNTDKNEAELINHQLDVKELIFIAWAREIHNDVVVINKSKIIGMGGTHRAGKSEWACCMGYIWDKTFFPRLRNRVVHTPKAFMDEIKYVKDKNIHGAVFVIDEGGVVAPSDAFYEEWYKTLNQAIQVMGYLNPIIIFCAVIRDNIGAKFRKLYNVQGKARRHSNKYSKIKIFDLNYDDLRGRTTPKRPVLRIYGKKIIMNGIKFGKPPKFISDAYKELSLPAKDALLNKFTQIVSDAETKGPPKGKREQLRNEQAEMIEKRIPDVVSKFQQYAAPRSRPNNITLDAIKIQGDLNIPYRAAQILKAKAEEMLNRKTPT